MPRVALWVTLEERTRWRRAADNQCVTLSAFARDAVRRLVSSVPATTSAARLGASSPKRGRPRRGAVRVAHNRLIAVAVSAAEHAAWSRYATTARAALASLVRGAVRASLARRDVSVPVAEYRTRGEQGGDSSGPAATPDSSAGGPADWRSNSTRL